MPEPITLALTAEQRLCLEQARDRHPKAYVRERAAALLKIASGQGVLSVSQQGLLRRRHFNTLYRWVHWYRTEGIAGLRNRPGRGRKPAFFPSNEGSDEGTTVAPRP